MDANVLIYERLRDEIKQGKSLRVAIDTSYRKAFSAIFVAHVTQFLTAAILFWLASGPVKGFALTLTIAVVASAVVSLTLTPMMCGRLLRDTGDEAPGDGQGDEPGEGILTNRFTAGLSGLIERTVEAYHGSLVWVLRHQRETLIGLGLNKIGRVAELPDTPSSRGMIAKVSHLVRVDGE